MDDLTQMIGATFGNSNDEDDDEDDADGLDEQVQRFRVQGSELRHESPTQNPKSRIQYLIRYHCLTLKS